MPPPPHGSNAHATNAHIHVTAVAATDAVTAATRAQVLDGLLSVGAVGVSGPPSRSIMERR
jgi:hypothetical protein